MSGKMTADGKEVEKHEALHKDDPSLDGMPTEVAANSRLKTTRDGIELFPQPSDDPRDPLVKIFPSSLLFEIYTDQRRTGRPERN